MATLTDNNILNHINLIFILTLKQASNNVTNTSSLDYVCGVEFGDLKFYC